MLFGTPFVMIYTSGMGTGLLTEEAVALRLGDHPCYDAKTDGGDENKHTRLLPVCN